MSPSSIHKPDLAARSPWSRLEEQQVELVPPKRPIDGTTRMPGSKSLTNRALIIAALAEGTSRIEGMLRSDDAYWCIDSLERLGVQIETEADTVVIQGTSGIWPNNHASMYAGAAGTIARFLPGALAIGEGIWRLDGSRRLCERPVAPIFDVLRSQGTTIQYEGIEGNLPATLQTHGLRGGVVRIAGGISSQFVSGLLLAAPYAREPMTIQLDGAVVQQDYIEMTLDMMRAFGIQPEYSDEQTIAVPTGQYEARNIMLEPDISTCCYFWALAAITNGRIRIEGIPSRTHQPDIAMLKVLERMGCTVRYEENAIEVQGTSQLRGGFTLNMRAWSDQTLTIAAMSPFLDGPVTLTDAAHIRHHECDRIAVMCRELAKLGIKVEEHADGLTVYPGVPQPALLDPHDDHRMAMALSLIGARSPGIRIADPGCVSKTCPDYYERLTQLGIQAIYHTC